MTHTIAGLNLLLGLVGFLWLFWRSSHRWDEYPDELKMLLSLTLALFFCLLTVSAEMFVADYNLSKSVVVIFLVKVFALVVLWRTRDTKYRTGLRATKGDAQPGNVNKDVPGAS